VSNLITTALTGTGTDAVGIAIAVTILIAVVHGGKLGGRARQVLKILRLGPSNPSDNQDSTS
jgi:hypothetical protein